MRYTGKVSHKLYKQLIYDKYKSYKAVISLTNDGNGDRPEFVKKRERNIQATMQQSSFLENLENFSVKNEREDSYEDIIIGTWRVGGPEGSPRDPLSEQVIQIYDPGGSDSDTTETTINEHAINKTLQRDTLTNTSHIKNNTLGLRNLYVDRLSGEI